jgi:hypothetical protein
MLKITLLSMGLIFTFLAHKFKLFSDDLQHRIGDWAITYTLAFLTFLSIHPRGEVSEEYIILFKAAAAIVTGLALTIGKLVIEYLFNKLIKRKK